MMDIAAPRKALLPDLVSPPALVDAVEKPVAAPNRHRNNGFDLLRLVAATI
jgi:hypothetical protein